MRLCNLLGSPYRRRVATLACIRVRWLSFHKVGAQTGKLFCSLLARKPLWQ